MVLNFTSRETAIFVWLVILLIFILRNETLRKGLGAVLMVIFRGPIRRWSMLLFIYIGLLCFALQQISLWQSNDLKATLIWLTTAGFYMLYRTGFEQPEPKELIGRVFREGFNLAVILEFMISSFTFPLFVEFCLVPMAALLAFIASSKQADDPRAQLAVRFADNILTLIGFGMLAHAGIQTAIHWQEVWQEPTAFALLLPIFLSILTIPFLWLLLTYMAYRDAFLRMHYLFNEFVIPRFFQLQLIWTFGIRYHEVRQWWRYCVATRPASVEALNLSLANSRDYDRTQRSH